MRAAVASRFPTPTLLTIVMFANAQAEEAARRRAETAAAASSARAEEEAKRARDNAAAGEAARKQAEESAAEARRLASEANAARSQLEVGWWCHANAYAGLTVGLCGMGSQHPTHTSSRVSLCHCQKRSCYLCEPCVRSVCLHSFRL
jgi:hypothetical protein